MIPTTYHYPTSRLGSETLAEFSDGRRAVINTQYGCVQPLGKHDQDCDQRTKMGGRCTCAHNADIMAAAEQIVEHAREHGKRGRPPVLETTTSEPDLDLDASKERKAAERAWDNLYNEGGEGYNPYRN